MVRSRSTRSANASLRPARRRARRRSASTYILPVEHGIGHKVDGSGRVSIVFPRGFNRGNTIK